MKNLDAAFQNALSQEVTTVAWCWLIERQDGVQLGFTSFDLPLIIGENIYQPQGFNPSAVTTTEGTERNDGQSLKSFLSDDRIKAADILAGLYDFAVITCFIVDVINLPDSIWQTPAKCLIPYSGTLGKAKYSDRAFEFEVRGLDHKLENKLGRATSKFCRYNLGDEDCTVNLTPYTFNQTITAVTNYYTFTIDGTIPDNKLRYGKLTFTSGNNNGFKADISNYTSNQITLTKPMPFPIEIGNTVTVVYGCDKTMLACAIYDNIINFGGEPDIPLTNKALNMPIDRDN